MCSRKRVHAMSAKEARYGTNFMQGIDIHLYDRVI